MSVPTTGVARGATNPARAPRLLTHGQLQVHSNPRLWDFGLLILRPRLSTGKLAGALAAAFHLTPHAAASKILLRRVTRTVEE